MNENKKLVDRMARGSKIDNTVFGTINGITDNHKIGKFSITIQDKKSGEVVFEGTLSDYMRSILGEIERLKRINSKLNKKIVAIATELDNYKERVGIR